MRRSDVRYKQLFLKVVERFCYSLISFFSENENGNESQILFSLFVLLFLVLLNLNL